jgi:hypothetical protein
MRYVTDAGKLTKKFHAGANIGIIVICSIIIICGFGGAIYCYFATSTDDKKCGRINELDFEQKCDEEKRNDCGKKCYPYRKSPLLWMGIFFGVFAIIAIIISTLVNKVVQKSSNEQAAAIGGIELFNYVLTPRK